MTAGIIDYKYKKEKQGVDLETLFVTALTCIYRRDRDHCSVCGIDRCRYLPME